MDMRVFKLEADYYDNIPLHTKVINISTWEYDLWVHFPEEISNACELFQLDEVIPSKKECNWLHFIDREPGRPWLKIISGILNKSAGQHIYKLSFIDRDTHDIVAVYFSYIVQDDNPDKPYIYMRRDSKTNGV